MTGHARQGSAFAAQLTALNALFEAARTAQIAHQEVRFIAFCEGVSSELARAQLQEVLDAICIAPRLDDLDAAIRHLRA